MIIKSTVRFILTLLLVTIIHMVSGICICEDDDWMENSNSITVIQKSEDQGENKVGNCLFGTDACINKYKRKGYEKGGW
jgi:hypothetical protein